MNKIRSLKYLISLTGPISALIALTMSGIWTYSALIFAFLIIPTLELIFKSNPKNLSEIEEEIIGKDKIYDYLLYLMLPVQYGLLILFLFSVFQTGLSYFEIIGRITAMGLMCGYLGINVAHELGHRNKWYEKLISKLLLLSSLYTHFFIEHNRGHHKNVSTPNDPATSKYGEIVFLFWFRSVIFSYISAWKIQTEQLKRKNKSFLSLENEMIVYQLAQILLVISIGIIFDIKTALFFVASAIFGFLLLETINYIEHYGLNRDKDKSGKYENVKPHHSWNSNHIVGRLLLFELSRHSDHHFRASRKYQTLRHFEGTPQMPTGYPGMIILALFPPLWFLVMNKRVKSLSS